MYAYRRNPRCLPSNQTGNQALDITGRFTPCLRARLRIQLGEVTQYYFSVEMKLGRKWSIFV